MAGRATKLWGGALDTPRTIGQAQASNLFPQQHEACFWSSSSPGQQRGPATGDRLGANRLGSPDAGISNLGDYLREEVHAAHKGVRKVQQTPHLLLVSFRIEKHLPSKVPSPRFFVRLLGPMGRVLHGTLEGHDASGQGCGKRKP